MDLRDLDIMDKRLVDKTWLEIHPTDGLVQIVKQVRKSHSAIGDLEIMGEQIDEHFQNFGKYTTGLGKALNEQGDLLDDHSEKIGVLSHVMRFVNEHGKKIETLEKQIKALSKIIVTQSKDIQSKSKQINTLTKTISNQSKDIQSQSKQIKKNRVNTRSVRSNSISKFMSD
jgi:ABC-type transporter Mla subunit MlaD